MVLLGVGINIFTTVVYETIYSMIYKYLQIKRALALIGIHACNYGNETCRRRSSREPVLLNTSKRSLISGVGGHTYRRVTRPGN